MNLKADATRRNIECLFFVSVTHHDDDWADI